MTTTAETNRWQKMLALLDSPHEGEAIAALMALRSQLATQNLQITDILSPAATPATAVLASRQHEIDALRGQLAAAQRLVDEWKETALLAQRAQERDQQSAAKWHRLAQATADSLWDLGQQLRGLDEPGTVVAFKRPGKTNSKTAS